MTAQPRPPRASRDRGPSASRTGRPAIPLIPLIPAIPVTRPAHGASATPASDSASPGAATGPAPTGPSPARPPAKRPPSVRPPAGPRTRAGRLVRALPAIAAVLGLASCGVSTTGVIEAGEAATAPSTTVNVYLVRDGQVVAVPRRTPGDPTITAALTLLFDGSTAVYSAKGYSSDLPRLHTPVQVEVKNGILVTVSLSEAVAPLRPVAMRQVVCTAADAMRRSYPDGPPFPGRDTPATSGETSLAVSPAHVPVLVAVIAPAWRRTGSSLDCP